jgi:uncharacterized membrane protein YhaH (DUF805 family)
MHWMIMPFKRYADFSGRSQRKEYWMFILLNWIIILPLFLFIGIQGDAADKAKDQAASSGPAVEIGVAVLLIYFVAIIVPSVAVAVRRFHDQDKSGWFFLLTLIPYVGSFIMLGFMVVDGTPGPNRYGPDPKGRSGGRYGGDDDGDIDYFSTVDHNAKAAKPPARIIR